MLTCYPHPWTIFSGLENVRPNVCHISLKEFCGKISCVSVESWEDGGSDIYIQFQKNNKHINDFFFTS